MAATVEHPLLFLIGNSILNVKLNVLPEVSILLVDHIRFTTRIAERPHHHRHVFKAKTAPVESPLDYRLQLHVQYVLILTAWLQRSRSYRKQPGDQADILCGIVKQVFKYFRLDLVDKFRSGKVGLICRQVDGREQLILYLLGIGVNFFVSVPINHLFALEDFKDTDAHNVKPFVMGQARRKVQYPLFIFPSDLKVQQFNSPHKLLNEFLRARPGLDVREHYRNEFIVVEEFNVVYHLALNFREYVDHVVVVLFDVVGVVHDHLHEVGQGDAV